MSEQLAFENDMVLTAVQAFVGLVARPVVAIAIDADATARTLDVHVASTTAVDARELEEELAGEVDAATGGTVLVRVHVWVGTDWTQGWPGRDKRLIFALER